MKVAFISNLYAETARGGAERIVQQEAESLAQSGHDVTVVTLCAPSRHCERSEAVSHLCHPREGGNPEKNKKEKIKIIHLPSTNIFHYLDLSKHSRFARLAWHLIDTFNSRTARAISSVILTPQICHPGQAQRDPGSTDTRVVHTHNLMGLGFLIPATLRRHHLRHIHTVHDVQLLHPSGLLKHTKLSLSARIYAAIMRSLMGSPAVVVFPSTFLKTLHDAHNFFPRSKKIVLANPAPAVEASSRSYPGPHFFFAGQLEAHKGIRELVAAWKLAVQASASEANLNSNVESMQNAELVIAGTGTLEAELRALAKDLSSIRFVGKLTPDQVRTEMLRSAWTIVPSTVIENAPAVISESLSAGTPVIASNIGGIPEFVQEGSTGTLVPPGNVEALATAIKKAATKDTWEKRSEACRSFAASRSIDAHQKVIESLYRA